MPSTSALTTERAEPSLCGAAGMVGWHHSSLAVDDLDVAAAFFRAAFGFSEILSEPDMRDQIAFITGAPGMRCGILQLRSPAYPHVLELIEFRPPSGLPAADPLPIHPGASHVAFVVADLAAARAAVESLGAVLLGAITDFDDGPALYCRVPGGAFVELEQAPAR